MSAEVAQAAWSHYVRFLGAGAIGVAAVWTLGTLVKPVVSGLAGAMATSRVRRAGRAETLPRTEQDMPIGLVGMITLGSLVPIGVLLAGFLKGGVLAPLLLIAALTVGMNTLTDAVARASLGVGRGADDALLPGITAAGAMT